MLVLDLSMPGRSGMELIKLVKAENPRLRILVLSMHQELQYAVRAIKSGANGYLTKESAPAQLRAGHPQDRRRAVPSSAPRSPSSWRWARCPARERAAACVALRPRVRGVPAQRGGASVTDIAGQLKLSVKTVSTHKANLMQKLGLHNQSELVRYAIRHGLAEQDLVAVFSLSRLRERAGVRASAWRIQPDGIDRSPHPHPLPQAGEGVLGRFLGSSESIQPRISAQSALISRRRCCCARCQSGMRLPARAPLKVFLADDSALIRARVAAMLATPA